MHAEVSLHSRISAASEAPTRRRPPETADESAPPENGLISAMVIGAAMCMGLLCWVGVASTLF